MLDAAETSSHNLHTRSDAWENDLFRRFAPPSPEGEGFWRSGTARRAGTIVRRGDLPIARGPVSYRSQRRASFAIYPCAYRRHVRECTSCSGGLPGRQRFSQRKTGFARDMGMAALKAAATETSSGASRHLPQRGRLLAVDREIAATEEPAGGATPPLRDRGRSGDRPYGRADGATPPLRSPRQTDCSLFPQVASNARRYGIAGDREIAPTGWRAMLAHTVSPAF